MSIYDVWDKSDGYDRAEFEQLFDFCFIFFFVFIDGKFLIRCESGCFINKQF